MTIQDEYVAGKARLRAEIIRRIALRKSNPELAKREERNERRRLRRATKRHSDALGEMLSRQASDC